MAIATCLATLLPAFVFGQSPALRKKLQTRYDVVWQVDDGMIMVNKGGSRIHSPGGKTNGKYGYVDTLGREIVPLKYDYATRFKNGFAVVAVLGKSGHEFRGLINRQGKEVVPCTWEYLGSINDGVAVGERSLGDEQRACSLIDTLGNVRPLKYNICKDFSNGYARVGIGSYIWEDININGKAGRANIEFEGKYGFITPDGELAIAAEYDEARDFDSKGMARVGKAGQYYVKWGCIDTTGKVVIALNFFSIDGFSGGLAVASKIVGGKQKYGYIDRSGNTVLPFDFDMATAFERPNAWVGVEKNGRVAYYLIDQKGSIRFSYPIYNLQDGGKYGQAAGAVRDENGGLWYGIVDNSGKVILPFEYDEVTIFSEWAEANNRWQEAAMATKEGKNYSFDITKRGE